MSDDTLLVAQSGISKLFHLGYQLGFLVRLAGQPDKGIDADIELTQPIEVQSRLIGVQVKSRSEFYITKKDEISITVEESPFKYWKSYGRPVILVAYSPSDPDNLYWTRVDNASSRTIKLSLEQKFDHSTLQYFVRIISQYHAAIFWNTKIQDVSRDLAEFGFSVKEIINQIEEQVITAKTLVNELKFVEAARIYASLAVNHKNVFSVWYNWVWCLLMSGKLDEAVKIANEFLRKAPERWELICLLSQCLGTLEKYEEAESYISKALKLAPVSPATWASLGILHYWQGRNKEAYEDFSVAATYDPTSEFIRCKLAACSITLEKYE